MAGLFLHKNFEKERGRTDEVLAAQIRLYRVRWFFEHLEFNLTMSLLWVTLIRNLIVSAPNDAMTAEGLSLRQLLPRHPFMQVSCSA